VGHSTVKCNQPRTELICSECGQTGHIYTHCTNTDKKCINCPEGKNNHRTLAASCPYRKDKVKGKLQAQKLNTDNMNNKTYARIVKATVAQTNKQTHTPLLPTPPPTYDKNESMKLHSMIMEAHVASAAGLGHYPTLLAETLKLNYDIDVLFPNRDSQKVNNTYHKRDKMTEVQEQPIKVNKKSDKTTAAPAVEQSTRPKTKTTCEIPEGEDEKEYILRPIGELISPVPKQIKLKQQIKLW
jgi:hypothetical protein